MSIATINGVEMYYEEHGDGIPLIFIHPPLMNSLNFIYQLQTLSKQFKVILFDIRGHGKSQSSQVDITYSLIVEDIKQLMDHLKIKKAFLCGYSTGSSIALEFLMTYPERSYGGILIGGMSEVHDLRLWSLIFLGHLLAKVNAISFLALSITWSNSNSLQLFWNMFKIAKLGNPRNVEQYYRFSLTYNCTERLATIHHPILLINGSKDKQFYSYGRQLHNRLPNSEWVFIQDVNHQIPTKAANQLNHLISQFINKHSNLVSETTWV